jgi:diacylglycerol O-acyltransferase
MNFGLLGDFDALPDIDAIADGIDASLAELLALARKAGSGARSTAKV